MALSRDSRNEQIIKAIKRAEKRLEQRIDMINWEYDTLMPMIDAMKAGKPVLGLNAGANFEVVVEDANPVTAKASGRRKTRSHRR